MLFYWVNQDLPAEAIVLLVYIAGMPTGFSAAMIFTALSLLNQIRFPLLFYPNALNALAEGQAALRRIATFLALEEAPTARPPMSEDADLPLLLAPGRSLCFCWVLLGFAWNQDGGGPRRRQIRVCLSFSHWFLWGAHVWATSRRLMMGGNPCFLLENFHHRTEVHGPAEGNSLITM